MAFYTSQIDTASKPRGLLGRIAAFMSASIEARMLRLSRRDRIEALEAKSDAELARMGLSRDQIAYHVYGDLFYN